MLIAMSGASGFIGSFLSRYLQKKGHTLNVINRDSFAMPLEEFTAKKIEGAGAVINLAGSPVVRRWTDQAKAEMVSSRIDTTRKIVEAITRASSKPGVFISASAVGIYDGASEHPEESSAFDTGFLADLVRSWEAEAMKCAGITRTAVIRTGVVLGNGGGALARMYLPFSIGLGGKIGKGTQMMSWIHVEDLAMIYEWIMEHEASSGIYNGVAPNPVTNRHFTEVYGKVLNQPTLLTVPQFVLKAMYGDGSETVTKGQNVIPKRITEEGFRFKFPTVEKALLEIYR